MNSAELQSFFLLKQKIEATYKERHTNCTSPIEDWKGAEIKSFQADLQEKLGGYLSEKWFYTHIKTKDNKKLPRVDMLNMLSAYIGFEDWAHFQDSLNLTEEAAPTPIEEEERKNTVVRTPKKKSFSLPKEWMLGVASIAILILLSVTILSWRATWNQKAKFSLKICVVDADDETVLREVEAELIRKEETALKLKSDSLGCFQFEQDYMRFQLVLKAKYYKTDTIERYLMDENHQEIIALKKDDYALMLHYFSTQKMEDWKKRRAQLDKMLADDVQIVQLIQIDGQDMGIEMYNKQEFINKMTLPVNSLKNIEIIKTEYRGQQIARLRFIQHED
jgi:hypothetical protein